MTTLELAQKLDKCLAAQVRLQKERDTAIRALLRLIADYDSIPEDKQIPDEINDNEHWERARAAIARAEGGE